jgi:hypothetical protein
MTKRAGIIRLARASQQSNALCRSVPDRLFDFAHQLIEIEEIRTFHEHLPQAPQRGQP